MTPQTRTMSTPRCGARTRMSESTIPIATIRLRAVRPTAERSTKGNTTSDAASRRSSGTCGRRSQKRDIAGKGYHVDGSRLADLSQAGARSKGGYQVLVGNRVQKAEPESDLRSSAMLRKGGRR